MDRHGGLAGEKMQGTRRAATNHIPGEGPTPSYIWFGGTTSCQAICTLTGADCHSTEAGTIVVRCLRVLQSGSGSQAAWAGGDSHPRSH